MAPSASLIGSPLPRGWGSASDGHELYFDDDETRSTSQNALPPLCGGHPSLASDVSRPRESLINFGGTFHVGIEFPFSGGGREMFWSG